MNNLVRLFEKLIRIDSPSGHEEQMRKYLVSWLKEIGFIFKTDRVGNIYATNRKKHPILLSAHMDTVEPGRGIRPVVKNGIISSSGSTILGGDNKAALACIMSAVETYQKNNGSRGIELLFTVKEETGGGIEHFPFSWIKSKSAFLFDSANPLGGIILASPYILNFEVTVEGKAAHSSEPKKGINALTAALEVLSAVKTGELDNGTTTVNVGVIHGGSGINTIPSEVRFAGEVRSYDESLFKKQVAVVKRLARSKNKNGFMVTATFDGYCPGYTHDKESSVFKQIEKIYENHRLKTTYYKKSGVSDANILNSKKIKAYNLTDGVQHPHTFQESVTVVTLQTLTKIVEDLLGRKNL